MIVNEPSVEDTIAILRGLQEKYEVHHGVEITDPAIVVLPLNFPPATLPIISFRTRLLT